MSFYALPTMIDAVKTFLQEGSAVVQGTGTFTNGQLLRRINMAYGRMVNEMVQSQRPELMSYQNMSYANQSTGELDLPVPPDMAQAICLTWRTNTVPSQQELNAARIFRHAGANPQGGWSSSVPYFQYEIRDNKFYIIGNRPAATGQTGFRLWYMRSTPPLSYAVTTANGTATTIELNPNPIAGDFDRRRGCQAIYRGVPIYIYDGTGVGQYGIITSVNTSFVATCVATDSIDGQPFVTTPPVANATYYSFQPVFPTVFYDLLVYYAAVMNTKYLGAQHAPFQEIAAKEAAWKKWLVPNDMSTVYPLVNGVQSDLGVGGAVWGWGGGFFGGGVN